MVNTESSEQIFDRMKHQNKVFISSPYTKPDPCVNVHNSAKIFNKLLDDGKCFPITLLWTHFFHSIQPRDYESWLAYCMSFIPLCDFMLVLPGESSGKDREIALAKSLGLAIFYSIEDLYAWIDEEKRDVEIKRV